MYFPQAILKKYLLKPEYAEILCHYSRLLRAEDWRRVYPSKLSLLKAKQYSRKKCPNREELEFRIAELQETAKIREWACADDPNRLNTEEQCRKYVTPSKRRKRRENC